MAKVQNDFYFRWAQDRIEDTYSSNVTLNSEIEFAGVDTALNTVQVELPDSSGTTVLNTKKIYIIDQGSAATNNITVIPNASDSTTIEGQSQLVISTNNTIVILELVDDQWVILANTTPAVSIAGAFNMTENTSVTTISAINTATDINGTAVASPNNNGFTFTTSPNALESTISESYTGLAVASATISRDVGFARRDVALLLFQDTGSGYSAVANADAEIAVNGALSCVSFSALLNVSNGDKFKLMIENRQNASNLVVGDMSLSITRGIK